MSVMGLAGGPTAFRGTGAGGLFRCDPENIGQKRGSLGARRPGWRTKRPITSGRRERTSDMGLARSPTALCPTALRPPPCAQRERTLGSCASPLGLVRIPRRRWATAASAISQSRLVCRSSHALAAALNALAAGTQADQRTYPRGLAQPPRLTSRRAPLAHSAALGA
jgi:hypothetical protein